MSEQINDHGQAGEDTAAGASAAPQATQIADSAHPGDAAATPAAATPSAEAKADPLPKHSYSLDHHAHLIPAGEGADRLQSFAGTLHRSGASQEVLDGTIAWYERAVSGGKTTFADLYRAQGSDPKTFSETVRWYANEVIPDGNLSNADIDDALRVLEPWPDEIVEPLLNDAKAIKFFAYMAAGAFPGQKSPTSAPAKPQRPAPSATDQRIAEIEQIMRADRRRYVRDEDMQAELRQLYAARGH
jgi:hypothetical protein